MLDHRYLPKPDVRIEHPEWSRSAAIYQLNIRQFSAEGTIRAAQDQLDRLAALGVSIIWLMPVHPIGAENRKGTLGSPYAVQDYLAVNPELGTIEDLRRFVAAAHDRDLHVILDWVANHTAWDNVLASTHPEFYSRDADGSLLPTPWWDWADIVDLDYGVPELRRYMTEAMAFWVREVGIDGYRCDVAGAVPVDFWNEARRQLDEIKPVFMLAEWEERDLHAEAFDATYAWSWYDALHGVISAATDLEPLRIYYAWNDKAYPRDAMRMTFVSNHDKNSWEGTEFEKFGPALEASIVLSVVGSGIPLVYNGQEAGNERRLLFFERDPIEWKEHSLGDLYRRLFRLKRETPALWNARFGARMIDVPNSAATRVLSFVRGDAAQQVFAVFNFSPSPCEVSFQRQLHWGDYSEFFGRAAATFGETSTLALEPWSHRVYVRDVR